MKVKSEIPGPAFAQSANQGIRFGMRNDDE